MGIEGIDDLKPGDEVIPWTVATIHTLQAEIERLTDFNKRLLEAMSDMVGIGRGYPLTEFSVQDVDPEIVNLLIEGGYYERSTGESMG